MGAGHDGAARELERRLRSEGHEVRIVDFLDCCPFGIGWFIKWSYLLQLRFAPWSYDLTYRLWYKMPSAWGFIVRLDTFVSARRIQRAINDLDADVVVSTYPLSSLVLGNMRRRGWLKVPAVTFLTDFGVHPLWVHPSIDLHVATSQQAAEAAAERHAGETSAPGPLVADRFMPATAGQREAARNQLGIADGERAVLVVAGSWGVGDMVGTVEAIARVGAYHPVTVCGRDEQLKAELEERKLGTVIGWTDEMPKLMAACDAMVENAGGLTANEAFAVGLPVVTFKPIAGHGKDNAEAMAEFGVTRYAHDDAELAEALAAVTQPGPERHEQIERARALFRGDAKSDVLELAILRDATEIPVPIKLPKAPRRVSTIAASVVLLYGGLTLGAQGVSAMGVGVAQPPKQSHHRVYVGVRLTNAQLADAQIRQELQSLDATAIVDGKTARASGSSVRLLAAHGVDVGNGGWGHGRPFRYLRAQSDVAKAGDTLKSSAGVKVREFVPERRLDAFDQMWCARRHQRLVEPDSVFKPERLPAKLHDDKVYVLDGRRRTPHALEVALQRLATELRAAGLSAQPLLDLR
jgi:UDP-N-acetylglucosamine:LPS N-acetylglucosamine transferase